ncbi:DUF302 domain-containing protein [Actinomycetospora lemnae]|uniref:DUF302 domain-containing protein n=1 Tax=Actinomycetospora lemnae TaxID=3019891 RepID=A0ABT5SYV4_9PSEU|nr:DUF302 domain-containing protein [Actinomycetospora sp. DW7H6]MDD7967974.1 DUF302 domain-containing protein [Actinomycetospora sp. DW7H6]
METRLDLPYAEAVTRVREALAAEGFGVLTEIDVRATMDAKLGVELEDYVILGACNPSLAYRALEVDRSVGLLLPCTVTVRAEGGTSLVEMLDPRAMVTMTGTPELSPIAEEARARLERVRDALAGATATGAPAGPGGGRP